MPKEEIVTTLEEINEKAKLQNDEYGDFNDPTEVEINVPSTKKAKAEPEDRVEIEVVDDTPEEDRGRKKMKVPPKEEDEADEVTNYNEKVQRRMDELKRAWHDERRAKERAAREQQAAVDYAKKIADENKRLLGQESHENKHRDRRKQFFPHHADGLKVGKIKNISPQAQIAEDQRQKQNRERNRKSCKNHGDHQTKHHQAH